MKILRWILFIPLAYIALIITGLVMNFIFSNLLGIDLLAHIATGIVGTIAFFSVGVFSAPKVTTFTKWSLISVALIISISTITYTLMLDEKMASVSSWIMLFFTFMFMKVPFQKLKERGR